MNDINKLLDEIGRLIPNVSSLEHWQETEGGGEKEFAGELVPPERIATLQALATAYREQGEKLEKAIFYLESISGGWDPDWMLKRAYEGLAELGVKGYETNGQELRETTKVD
jgi:hypothetical protein